MALQSITTPMLNRFLNQLDRSLVSTGGLVASANGPLTT